jgi:DNA repair protein SbcC/Rad50
VTSWWPWEDEDHGAAITADGEHMRPRRLVMTAFGPFGGTIDLDFGQLDDTGVFLIHGPTGAGKTTILDAITYALYGEVGGGRQRDRLRSDHAEARAETTVAFEFCMRGEDWRITRTPKQQRTRRRGQGITVQAPTATLARRRATGVKAVVERPLMGGDVLWEPVVTGVQEVGMAIVGLLGLDRQQFQQVVVLPQGQVFQALRASAHDRERLLASLFDARRFEAHTARLADRARALEADVDRRAQSLEDLRRQAADRRAELDGDDDALVETQADLDVLRAAAERSAADAAVAVAHARADAAATQDALLAVELLADRCRRRADAERTLAEADADAARIDTLRDRLARGERAAPCASLLCGLDAAEAALRDASRRCRAVDAPIAQAAARLPAGLVGDLTLDRLHRLAALIERLTQDAREAKAAAERAAVEHAAAREHRAAADLLEAQASRLDDEIASAAAQRDEAKTAAASLDQLRERVARLTAAAEAAAEVPALDAVCTQALAAERAAVEVYHDALRVHTDLLQRRIDGMAAELAAGLTTGQACPVCGSVKHPAPAVSTASPVEAAEIRAAEVAAAELRAAANTAQQARREACDALAEARARAGGADLIQARADADTAERELAALIARAASLADLQARVDELTAQAGSAREAAAKRTAQAAEARAAEAAAGAQAVEAAARVTAVLGPEADAEMVAADLATLIARLTELRDAQDAERAAEIEHAGAARRLADLLAAQGFGSADEARLALDSRAEWPTWRALLAEHDRRRANALAALADPALADLPGGPPDVDAARAACEEAEKAADVAVARHSVVRRVAADLALLAERHAQSSRALAPVRADAERVRRLAAVCDGSGNQARMSLERYVLAAYLEEITEAASARLVAMTDGRYRLRHSDERARHGAASGLSVVVGDAWTGVEREVASLSGGETFQAALAFALGLADVVQRHTGGVHLDTLFVDEGFGSLDPDALEQAMAELDRLREGGRLVGVISHVPALRERISAGIRVTRTPTGSHAQTEVARDR